MFIRVGHGVGPELVEPEDCKKFHVEAPGHAEGAFDAVLAELGDWAATGADGHVWIRIDAVRGAAAGRVPAGWDGEFEGMVGYARSKGWLDDSGSAIRAHVVYGS